MLQPMSTRRISADIDGQDWMDWTKSPGWKGIYIQASSPVTTRGGTLLPLEGNRWKMSLTGGSGDCPPTDENGLADFVRNLPSALIHNAVKAAEPLSPIFGNRATQNRRRHYENLPRWPDGLVVLGDAACTVNPDHRRGGNSTVNTRIGKFTTEKGRDTPPASLR